MIRHWLAVPAAFLLTTPVASAQSLSELLPRLLSESVTMPSTVGTIAGNPHEAHFLPAVAQLTAPYALNGALVTQLATFPIGSSSGGFTYTLDERTGIPQRSSGNFGPSFAERALTIGKGQLSIGINYQHVRFERFEGVDLEGGAAFYLQHNDCCPLQGADGSPNPNGQVTPSFDSNPFFEGDLVRAALSLEARTDTTVIFANYGVTDDFDVSLALPIVRVQIDARMNSTILRLATAGDTRIHSFGGTSPNEKVSEESGSASGLGDVLVRAKYRLVRRPGGGLAAGVDLRLPTGNKDDLLGTGATQAKLSLLYSGDFGRVSPHVNVGYTLSSGSLSEAVGNYSLGDDRPVPLSTAPDAYNRVFRGNVPTAVLDADELKVPNEIDYTAGVAVSVNPRITLNADLLGRTLLKVNRFEPTSQSYNFRVGATGALTSVSFDDGLDITEDEGKLNLLLGVAGVKVNVSGTVLLNANVLFPLSDGGLRPSVTGVVGLDYAF